MGAILRVRVLAAEELPDVIRERLDRGSAPGRLRYVRDPDFIFTAFRWVVMPNARRSCVAISSAGAWKPTGHMATASGGSPVGGSWRCWAPRRSTTTRSAPSGIPNWSAGACTDIHSAWGAFTGAPTASAARST